jgi:phage FluMu protein Com
MTKIELKPCCGCDQLMPVRLRHKRTTKNKCSRCGTINKWRIKDKETTINAYLSEEAITYRKSRELY